ncbi:beta-lactamase/transpeptidase-like protein [Ilyonectria robusta]|uniref:beta-lactamase/transpeptidase-like protein n=1 Tax=Ilyonectria robusta TaxID=1079257 RepID=UPI001E8D7A96|nr:beta-lactamase/transpeptidase-like protein [Ilyonectria robusta]KAH8658544.1 beta-lactamase/transpeptidase-like protein [Ilyonectria robusta]
MDSLHHRLDNLGASIQELMRLGGTPGLSLSVATKGQPIYHASYGVRDLETALPVTENTIFPVCSLAKTVSAAAMGILVEQGVSSWEMLAKDAVPGFKPRDETLEKLTTLADLFSHRSGMSSCGNLVMGCEGNVLIGRDDCLRVVNNQVLVPAQLGSFAYNSTAYDLCGEAIENLSGSSMDDFIQAHIFNPLGMDRTFLTSPPDDIDDVSKSYNALDDATPVRIPSPKLGDNGVGGASGGLRSCASDLIRLYSSFLTSFNHEFETDQTLTPGSPLKQVSHLMSAKVPMFKTARNEISYGLGWARVQLPNTLGHIGLNGRLMPGGMPVVGRGVPSQLVLYHQGTLPGALAVVLLVPETESVILVMSNCLSLTDVPDWVSQMVLEVVLGVPALERIDFLRYAESSIAANLQWHSCIVGGLEQGRSGAMEPHMDLKLYVGTYIDDIGVFKNVVTLENGKLSWAFQGLDSEKFELAHYDGDKFTWLQPRNVLSRRGRWVLGNDKDPAFWIADFRSNERGNVTTLLWRHDPTLDPIIYWKR